MRKFRKLIGIVLLAAVASFGALAGPQESPGALGPQESPGITGPQESPGIQTDVIAYLVSWLP